jgi:hypothetical protein
MAEEYLIPIPWNSISQEGDLAAATGHGPAGHTTLHGKGVRKADFQRGSDGTRREVEDGETTRSRAQASARFPGPAEANI